MGKKAVWKWGDEEEMAFQALNAMLLQYPVLTVPNFKLPMILHTDASDVVVGATLSQNDEGGVWRLVACRSRKLSPAEKNYPVHEKEMLALVDTLEEWRHYLLGVAVLVYTVNSATCRRTRSRRPDRCDGWKSTAVLSQDFSHTWKE